MTLFFVILSGSLSFFILTIFDYLQLISNRKAWIPGLIGMGLFVFSVVTAIILSPVFPLPVILKIFGWLVFTVSVFFLIWSLFLELPFSTTYLKSDRNRYLVTWGTYALCRHPGVLWLSTALISLFFATGAKWLLIAAPVWIACDILHVFVQEKYFFGRMFDEYENYQKEVPFLKPTKASIVDCLKTIFKQ